MKGEKHIPENVDCDCKGTGMILEPAIVSGHRCLKPTACFKCDSFERLTGRTP